MKHADRPLNLQLNLPLLNIPAAELPEHKQRELVLALVDLLVNVATQKNTQLANGGSDESETH